MLNQNHNHKPRGAKLSLLLILLLVGSNLATAIGAYLVIDRISGHYVQELQEIAPGMHEVMLLAQKATDVHRAAAALLLARTPAEETQMLARLKDTRDEERQLRNQILDTVPHGPGGESSRKALGDAATDYEATINSYLSLLGSKDRHIAQDFRLSRLRDSFETYQQRQREESVRLNMEAMQSGLELSSYASTQKSWLLSIGTWPLALFGLVFIAVFAFGAILWRQLRRMETDEHDLTRPHHSRF